MKLFDEMRIAHTKKNVNEMAIFFKEISYMHKKKEENIVYSFYMKLYTEDYKEFELFCRCFSKNRVRSAVIL